MLARYYPGKKLIVVPTTSLVHQMASDFSEYGYEVEVQKITAGATKEITNEITVTTWQSIYKLQRKWFDQFSVVIGDEAHLFKAKSLTSIMSKLNNTPYRFGFTGTLDGSQTHRLVLEGLFGPVERVTTTSDLIKNEHLANLKINICILDHADKNKKSMARANYRDEIDYIVGNAARNDFLINVCNELKGNSLLLFALVEKHGKPLYDLAQTCGPSCTGVNIRRLSNVVFASPSKSKIRVLQSIGRGLRTAEDKTSVRLFDIVDDLRQGKWINFTLRHYTERLKIYNDEQFPYKIHSYKLKE